MIANDDLKACCRRPILRGASFVVTSLAAGFALAVQPVAAETITTDTNGLVASEVKIPTKDGQIPAYRAMPVGRGPFPRCAGGSGDIRRPAAWSWDVCRRFAKLGHMAIAPELYARQGDVSKITDFSKIISGSFPKCPMPR